MVMFGVGLPVLILATLVGILSAARLTRLVVSDHWPPVLWIKGKWDARMGQSGWWLLLNCPWCLAPWFSLLVGAWAVVSHLHWTWWAFNAWLGLSYVASWLVFHDEDPKVDEPEATE